MNYYPSPAFSAASISTTGAGHIGGDFDVATSKFTVASATGNTLVAGTLTVTGAITASSTVNVVGNFSVATNKMTVAAASGNTVIAGTLGVTGDVAVNTNKFTVTASSGNTVVAGTLGVTGAATLSSTLAVAGITSTVQIAGPAGSAGTPGVVVGANKFGLYDDGAGDGVFAYNGGAYLLISSSGSQAFNNTFQMAGGISESSVVTPTQLTGNVTDYNPFGGNLALKSVMRLSSDASRTINSMLAGSAGQLLWIINVGTTNDIVLLHDDGATGTAANRFLCPNSANYTMHKNETCRVWYDSTSSRWRVMDSRGSVL